MPHNITNFTHKTFHFITFSQLFIIMYKHAFHPKTRKNGKKWGCEYSPGVILAFGQTLVRDQVPAPNLGLPYNIRN